MKLLVHWVLFFYGEFCFLRNTTGLIPQVAAPPQPQTHTQMSLLYFHYKWTKDISVSALEELKAKLCKWWLCINCGQDYIIWRPPFGGGWRETADCRLVGFCFVFKKFALVCHYGISRKGKQRTEEIATLVKQSSLKLKCQRSRSCLCHFLLYPQGLVHTRRSISIC